MKQLHFSIGILLTVFFMAGTGRQLYSNGKITELVKKPLNNDQLIYPALVNKFYQMNGNKLFWFTGGKEPQVLRQQLLDIIDTAFYYGLIQKEYHFAELNSARDITAVDSTVLLKADRLYTDAAIAVFKDIYHGYKKEPWEGYDQLTEKCADAENEYLLNVLLNAQTAGQLKLSVELLEPVHQEYVTLKRELRRQKQKQVGDTAALLRMSMNYYRWIHHFQFDQFIVINLPAARLRYYQKDSILLNMKTVVGEPSTPTPRFATVCDQAILYPYWYVPRSIIFNEYLRKIKNNPGWLDAHNMQVIDGSGKVVDHHKLNWVSFHTGYFPYTIRQSTGCDNALGVIKFNIITPYGVYLHDTNNKTAFLSGYRYYSHGCIRIEKPLELGNHLLSGKLDKTFLQSCFKEQKPIPVLLEKPVPVFAVYMLADADVNGKISYYKDVYKLMNK